MTIANVMERSHELEASRMPILQTTIRCLGFRHPDASLLGGMRIRHVWIHGTNMQDRQKSHSRMEFNSRERWDEVMKKDKCRSCGAPVRWCLTSKAKWIPVDRDPVPDGNLAISKYGKATPIDLWTPADQRYKSHFATCPNADEWRKKETP